MKRDIKVAILDPDNKTANISISYVSTATSLTSATIITFTKKIVSLTDNTYISTTENTTNKLD